MTEHHVFPYDSITVNEAQMRGGKGKALCRFIAPESFLPGPFSAAGVHTLPPGVSIGPHRHEGTAELILIVQGRALYTDKDGGHRHLKTGDITICYEGESHSIENDGAEPLLLAGIIVKSA